MTDNEDIARITRRAALDEVDTVELVPWAIDDR